MKIKNILITAVATVFAMTLPVAAAQAAPTQVGTASDLYEVAIDGSNLYWNNDRLVTKVDIATGATSVVFRAPRGMSVYDMEAAGGTLSVLIRKFAKKKSTTKAYVRSAATGKLRVAAKGTAKYKGAAPVCGTEIQLGSIASTGEALIIRNRYSISKKICKKPENLESAVIGARPESSRLIFNGRFSANNPLLKLGIVFDADLSGDKLLLVGFNLGVLNLTSNAFAIVSEERRNSVTTGELDSSGNPLVTHLKGTKLIATTELLNAESGYSAITPIEANVRGVVWNDCGDFLMRSKYDLGKNQTSAVTVMRNPLAPAGAPGATALAEGVNQPLWTTACDSANVAYAVVRPGASTASLMISPLAG